jgi:hypothetical protein
MLTEERRLPGCNLIALVTDLLGMIGAHVFDEAPRSFGRNTEIPFHDSQCIAVASKPHSPPQWLIRPEYNFFSL